MTENTKLGKRRNEEESERKVREERRKRDRGKGVRSTIWAFLPTYYCFLPN